MTWTVIGGAEWRLTLFAYAFYLVAAFWLVEAVRLAHACSPDGVRSNGPNPRPAGPSPGCRSVRALVPVLVWWIAVPYALTREAFPYDDAAMIAAGPAIGGSSSMAGPAVRGERHVAVCCSRQRDFASFCPKPAPYAADSAHESTRPFRPALHVVHVSLNGIHLDDLVLEWNPERIGQYQIDRSHRHVHSWRPTSGTAL